jgi:hypothetical protein
MKKAATMIGTKEEIRLGTEIGIKQLVTRVEK